VYWKCSDMNYVDPELDSPKEECGVIGISTPGVDAAQLAFFGIYALQHRGQEAAGIAVADGQAVRVHKDMGLVSQVFDAATDGSAKITQLNLPLKG